MFAKPVAALAAVLLAWVVFAHPSQGAGPERTYVVQPTDTLWSIAAANYAGDPREAIWRVQERNGLDGTLLRPGQKLVLPAAG